jgi:hypothetical protein
MPTIFQCAPSFLISLLLYSDIFKGSASLLIRILFYSEHFFEPVFVGDAILSRTRIPKPCLCLSCCYHIKDTFKYISSLLITQLLYAVHLYQSSVYASNSTIIFRTRRNAQSLMVTLLHAEHVYQNLIFVSHAVIICITLTSMICLCQQRYNYIQNTSKRPVYDGYAITCRTRILEPCLC